MVSHYRIVHHTICTVFFKLYYCIGYYTNLKYVQLGHRILSSSILIMNIFKTGQCMGQLWPTRQTGHETHCTCKSDDIDYVQGCVNISVSEGETELEPGGNPLDWKDVARLHPWIVKRLRTMVWGREFSTNLRQRGEEIEKNENLLELFSVHMLSEMIVLLVSSYCCATLMYTVDLKILL